MPTEYNMSLTSDLVDIIKCQFDKAGICYEDDMDVCDLAVRYLEMLNRRVVPIPRRVHFSEEINDSLEKLVHEPNAEQREKTLEARRTVFYIRDLLLKGSNVTRFLSKGVNNVKRQDKLLWDFGMHHFHLNRALEPSGDFVERSDYLLFGIITDADAYFVDIRPHHDDQGLEWVRQDLLGIVHSNWPELTNSHVLYGVSGDIVTDEQKKELRRKNINHIPNLGEQAVAPLNWGTNLAGDSTFCRIWGNKLLWEIKRHEDYFYRQPSELRAGLERKGIELPGDMEFQLVLLDSMNPPPELVALLTADDCLSRDLCRMGFAIVEATKRLPIVVSLIDQP